MAVKSFLLTTCAFALAMSVTAPVKAATPAVSKPAVSGPMSQKTFNQNYIGEMKTVRANYEDTLVHLGRDNGIGFVEMRAANPHLDPWIPGDGAEVVIPSMHLLPDAPRDSVVVNLAEMRMYLYRTPGQAPETYPIGIGRDGLLTPVGTTTITRKKAGPTWTPTPRMRKEDPTLPAVVQPGPDNPMGTHALYLGFPQMAIHGTNKPYGIGRRVSSGCIRMFPEDIGKVFDRIPVGAKVTVVDQPIKAAWIGDKFYLEVSPTQDQSTMMEREGAVPDYELSEKDLAFIMKKAGPGVEKLDWAAIRKVVKERKGYPVEIAEGSGRVAARDVAPPVQPVPKLTDIEELDDREGMKQPLQEAAAKPMDAPVEKAKPAPKAVKATASKSEERKPFYRDQ